MENSKQEIFKEVTLPSGEIISLTNQGACDTKPWNVSCWDTNNECRWSKDFVTEEEAEKEYKRFQ